MHRQAHAADAAYTVHLMGPFDIRAGDVFMRWTDDVLKSTYHRVRTPEHSKDSQVMSSKPLNPLGLAA